jgi:NADH-quinone oxidoreductase subunit G
MKYMTVDKIRVPIEGETNVLSVIRKAGVDLPTFCYHSDLSTYGACRMCVVEDEHGAIFTSCSEQPREGMTVYTHTPRLQKYRRMILELLLASHCRDCTCCEKNGRCTLQKLAARFGVKHVRFANNNEKAPLDDTSPGIVRDPNKCILCGDCVRMCSEVQGMGVMDFAHRGASVQVTTDFDRRMAETDCVGCGQCAAVCPTGALTVKNETHRAWGLLRRANTRVVAQIAPAVRVALGEEFNISAGENVNGKIVAALHRLGFDEVYDTAIGADLAVVEESKEFMQTLAENRHFPLFTSCCPAWVKYCEQKYPELVGNLSTCRSPMQMLSALIQAHRASTKAADGLETAVIAIMPCTAKKGEAARSEYETSGSPDTDLVLTTQELSMMIREAGIRFDELEAEAPDMPFGMATGAGVLFGVTGGVSEAVLRRCRTDRTQECLNEISFSGVRGQDGIKEATVDLAGRALRVAVVSGLKNTEMLLERIESGEAKYDFVEVMACPGGCVSGAGQPIAHSQTRQKRAAGIYQADKVSHIKHSEENPMILWLYNGILKGRSRELLHIERGDIK